MTTPDPLAVRGYQLVSADHQKNAARALKHVQDKAAALSLADSAEAFDTAQRLAVHLGELTAHLVALKTLDEVSFLTTGL